MGSGAGLGGLEERVIFRPCRDSDTGLLGREPCRFTDCAGLAVGGRGTWVEYEYAYCVVAPSPPKWSVSSCGRHEV